MQIYVHIIIYSCIRETNTQIYMYLHVWSANIYAHITLTHFYVCVHASAHACLSIDQLINLFIYIHDFINKDIPLIYQMKKKSIGLHNMELISLIFFQYFSFSYTTYLYCQQYARKIQSTLLSKRQLFVDTPLVNKGLIRTKIYQIKTLSKANPHSLLEQTSPKLHFR